MSRAPWQPGLVLMATLLAACASPSPRDSRPSAAARQLVPPAESATVAVGADTVSVLGWGEATFSRLSGLLNGSRRSIDLEMYEFGRPDLAQALLAARRRGVAVRVILDPTVRQTEATATLLRAGGIEVLDYPVQPRMIDHVKLLVVDGEVAVVGGINWGANSHRNHDFDAVLHGPAVTNLEHVFDQDLVSCGRSSAMVENVPDPAILVASTVPGTAVRALALNLLEAAQTSLDLEQFVLTDRGAVAALIAAHHRGVAVQVLLDPGQRPSDAAAALLRADGIDVRIYLGRGKLHAKAAVADGRRVLFGSANWTSSGFRRNHELDVEIVDSPSLARTFLERMAADRAQSGPPAATLS